MNEQKTKEREVVEVAYCRVSTEQESQTQSFKSQMEHYQKLFKKNNSKVGNCGAIYQDKVLTLTTNGIYADEGISGAKAYKNREAFMRMIKDAKLGLFNKINVKNSMRFSREGGAGEELIKDLSEIGVEVYFEEGNLSSFNSTHLLVINMMFQVGQQESRAKSTAIQWGIRRQQEKGKYHAIIAPYGYNRKEGYLEINQDEAEVIREIFRLYLDEGFGTQKIARVLNERRIPTKLNKQWSNKQIIGILNNEICVGKQITNKTNIDATSRFKKRYVDEEDQLVNDYEHLRIISDEMFDSAQLETKRRAEEWSMTAKKHKPSQVHLLSNLIKCGNCGGGYGRKKRKAYIRKDGTSKEYGYEWVCNTNDKYGKDRCGFRNQVIEEDIIAEIKKELSEFQNDLSSIYRQKAIYLDVYHNAETRLKQNKELEERLAKLNKQVKLNFELLGDEIIGRDEYKKRNDELQSEIKLIDEEMKGLTTIGSELKKVERDFNYFIATIKGIDTKNLTNAKLKKVINKIEVITQDGEKHHYIDWKFLGKPLSEISLDATMKAMIEDHPDQIPPEFRNQIFKA